MKRILQILCLAISLNYTLIAADADSPSTESEQKDHHFFIGIDLRFPHEKEYYSMLGLARNEALIRVGGDTIAKSIRKVKNFQIRKETKISKRFIQVENISCEPDYSLERNPWRKAERTNMMLESMASDTQDRVNSIKSKKAVYQSVMDQTSDPMRQASIGAIIDNLDATIKTTTTNKWTVSPTLNKNDIDDPGKDILRVSFDIKANQQMVDPYVVLILKLKNEERGDVVGSWFHFQSLDPFAEASERVNFIVHEYPDGKYIESQEIYFFEKGQELASNLSEKRVAMSRSDARIFLTYQYISRHSGETLKPTPIWNTFNPELLMHLEESVLNASITIEVDQDGNVTRIRYPDPNWNEPAADNVTRELKQMIFYPALQGGKPISGELTFKLRDYIL